MRGILLLLLVLFSCKAHKPSTIFTDSTIVSKSERQVPIVIDADSSFVAAKLEVIDGKVSVGDVLASYRGNRMNAPVISIKDNVLSVEAKAFQDTNYVTVYDTKERRAIHSTEIRYENVLTKWQAFQLIAGRICLALLLLIAILLYIKRKITPKG